LDTSANPGPYRPPQYCSLVSRAHAGGILEDLLEERMKQTGRMRWALCAAVVLVAFAVSSQRVVGLVKSYIVPVNTLVSTDGILTTGENIGGYRMVGIPDVLGVFDNGAGTFTLLLSPELTNTARMSRLHNQL